MQLKVPPDKVARIADAIEHHILSGDAGPDTVELDTILTWLRFRVSKWNAEHPENPAA